TDRRRPPRRRMALLAAAVLAVAGIGGAMALTRDDGGGDGETVVATPPDAEADATGWYVPDTMPEGWELESVETDWVDGGAAATFSCPCETTSWISDGDAAMVLSKYVGDLPDGLWGTPDDAATTVELSEGVNGYLHEIGPVTIIQWGLDAHIWSLSARGPTSDQVVHAATAVVADPSLTTPPLDGFSRLVDVTVPAGVRGYHSVLATFVNAHSGRRASFGLIPEGLDPGAS